MPVAKQHQLKADLTIKEQVLENNLNDKQALKNLILNGSIMQEEEYQDILERKNG